MLLQELSDPQTSTFKNIFSEFFQSAENNFLVDCHVGQKYFQHPAEHLKQVCVVRLSAYKTYFLDLEYLRTRQVMVDQNFCLVQHRNFLKPGMLHNKQLQQSRSNGRAEVAAKQAKRLPRSNVTESESLDSNRFLSVMLQLRNIPYRNCKVSPAEIIYGQQLQFGFALLRQIFLFVQCDLYGEKH